MSVGDVSAAVAVAASAARALDAEAAGVDVAGLLDRLPALLATVARLGQRWNLVGDPAPRAVVEEHIVEALTVAVALAPLRPAPRSLVEVGAGAGLEVTTLLLLWPQAMATALEPRQRRADCIELLADAVGVGRRLRVLRQRLGEPPLAATFDFADARATLPPPQWLAKGAALLAPDGVLALHHGAELDLESLAGTRDQLAVGPASDRPGSGATGLVACALRDVPGSARHRISLWAPAGAKGLPPVRQEL